MNSETPLLAITTNHNLSFHNRYWLCVANGSTIKIWDLEGKESVTELKPEIVTAGNSSVKEVAPQCISLAWSADGCTLYSGYTDNKIRVWKVASSQKN